MSKFFSRLGGVEAKPQTQPQPAAMPVVTITPGAIADGTGKRLTGRPRASEAKAKRAEPFQEKPIKIKPGRKKTGPKSVEHRVRDDKGHFVSREEVDLETEKKTHANADYPFLNARFFSTPNGQIMTDVNFNAAFVDQVDAKFEGDSSWDTTMPNNAKVAMFLYAMMEQAVEPYLAEIPEQGLALPEGYDPMEHIPAMAVRGGVENKTVVDISKMGPKNRIGNL